MTMRLNPYISFKDNAREAMEFYQVVFGGKLDVSTFKDLQAPVDAEEENLVMHSQLETDSGLLLMGADTPKHMQYQDGARISVSLSGDDEAALKSCFDSLSAGGTITQPLEKAVWGDWFGMCTDKYGVNWLVNISGAKQ
jgi:PhnB protein